MREKSYMKMRRLNLNCIIINEWLRFNVKKSHNFLKIHITFLSGHIITLNLDRSYLII